VVAAGHDATISRRLLRPSSDVIASEAKQSRVLRAILDCFVAFGSSQ
jgi:hypothetical protein